MGGATRSIFAQNTNQLGNMKPDYTCWGERELIEELERRDAIMQPLIDKQTGKVGTFSELLTDWIDSAKY